jgi:dihydrodiol dehydrogenase / D-xylose 1-dehydrogenase (NADP)
MSSGTVKWGIFTCGNIANDFANALKSTPNAQIVACGARVLKRAQEFSKIHGIPVAYGSYQELVQDKNVQIVYISSLHNGHYEHTMLALNHGKHVLVEKPGALNSKQLKAMYQLASEKNLFLMEGFWTIFFPAFRKVQELVSSGAIGEVNYVAADFTAAFPPHFDRVWKPELAGGALLDIGFYAVAMVTMLINGGKAPPTEIKATALLEGGVDVVGAVVLKYGEKKVGVANWNGKGHSPSEILVVGSKGYIRVLGPAHHPKELILYRVVVPGDNLINNQTETTHYRFPFPDEKTLDSRFIFSGSVGFIYEATHVQNTLLQKKKSSEVYPPAASMIVMHILDEVRRQIGLVYPGEDLPARL